MMNNMLEVLIHFFKRGRRSTAKTLDSKQLLQELNQFGLSLPEIEKALNRLMSWLDSHVDIKLHYPVQSHIGTRVFTVAECAKLNKKCRTFLLQLEQRGILTPVTRERVIDQLMQMDRADLALPQVQWLVFQTALNEAPPEHIAYLEQQVFKDILTIH